MKFKQSLTHRNPHVAHEWSYLNSLDFLPSTVSCGSHKHAIWECPEGHIYSAQIKSRGIAGTGCPYCSGQKALPGFNDLASKYPQIAAEWHPNQTELTPETVTVTSNRKVWWRCRNGHEWMDTIWDRTGKGYGCPFCSGKRVIPGETDLETLRPDIAAEWHKTRNGELKPTEVKMFSDKRVWWLCINCGHEWNARIADRSMGTNCPACVNKTTIPGLNDLQTTNYELALEWNYEKNKDSFPTKVSAGSGLKVWWSCSECGHEWVATIASRNNGRGCPCCANKTVITGVNDLASTNPELAANWHPKKNNGLSPEMVTEGSGKSVWWQDEYGHEWQATVSNRSKGTGCPYCNNTLPIIGETDLATVNPVLANEWDYERNANLTPQNMSAVSGIPVWWNCKNGHHWLAKISNRANGAGCPYCWGRVAAIGETDLATVNPSLASEWHPTKNRSLTPQMFTPNSNTNVFWQCHKNPKHVWRATINDRTNGNGCPFCANKAVLAGDNDLATTNPELVPEWHPTKNSDITPQMLTKGSSRKVWWQCRNSPKHEWQATAINKENSGCPYCHNLIATEGENDLATTHPNISTEWNLEKNGDKTPKTITAKSTLKVWWKCPLCGIEWESPINYRTSGRGNCPGCRGKKIITRTFI